MAIRIIVDSSADIEEDYARDHGIQIIPMTITFGNEEFAEGVDITRTEFFQRLVETDELPRTSQIPPMVFQDIFQEIVTAGDTAVVITLSSHISGTYQSACIAAAPFKESVFVVDSENATIGERLLAERAWALREEGLSAADIAYCLDQEKKDIRLVASLDTLEYLHRGGRISGAAAAIGGLLSIKPVVGVVDGDVVVLGKARGSKASRNMVFEEIEKAGGVDLTRPIWVAYSGLSDKTARKYIADSLAIATEKGLISSPDEIEMPLTLVGAVIGTHVGPGGVAFAFFARE
ncbi:MULTISPECIES: DegV family protein [Adlercreutzia]|uniref:DegV family EDD domain-containing protein n=1 Tax=Adlercreutzia rubneri TaxID=2916441 RepID=A0A7K1T817_9ACTN|nr:DegV family protein [Adlercreutzia sp.]MCB6760302.1 DegV family protein [Adlercreutzia equolifaciens]MDE8684175.1 DegV family protein [Adlercreutzia rubneri]MCB6975979.1 DegV family protein [Adlercreutzia equolifaciens]MEE0637180.1 DegV family protein [Adlercreutzia sp.]MVN59777.1 DegV family EDD domain-containing protein [Adlercreutzia rubneri]